MTARLLMTAGALLLLVVAGRGQDVWTLRATAPQGWTVVAEASRRAVYRKDFASGESAVLRAAVSPSSKTATDAADYIAKLKRPADEMVDGSLADLSFAGIAGKKASFRAQEGKTRTRREVAVARTTDGSFVVVRTDLGFEGEQPSGDALLGTDAAMKEVLRSLTVAMGPPEKLPETRPAPRGALATLRPQIYRSTTILPVQFRYPDGWYVNHDDGFVPGSLFVLATPLAEEAQTSPLEDLATTLRIQAVSHVSELTGADDGLDRALAFARESLDGEFRGATWTEPRTFVLGGSRAAILEFSSTDAGKAGLLLVTVAETAAITAEFAYPIAQAKDWKLLAYEILNTLNVTSDGGFDRCAESGIEFECPISWGAAKVKTDDGSIAVAMRAADGTEVTARSIALPAEKSIDAAAFKALAKQFLVEEMKLASPAEVDAMQPVTVPGAEFSGRFVKVDGERTLDVFAMVRGGAAHFAFVACPDGIQTAAYGKALRTVMSFSGAAVPKEVDLLAVNEQGFFTHPIAFGKTPLAAYDRNGNLRTWETDRIRFATDGRATLFGEDDFGPIVRPGTYKVEGEKIVISFEGGAAIDAQLSADEAKLTTTSPSRTWFVVMS